MKSKKLLVVFGFCLFTYMFWLSYNFVTRQFSLENVTYHFPQKADEAGIDLQSQQRLKKILSQTFTYFDQGTQSYVFMSEDQKYVLKFFKFRHLKPSPFTGWLSFLPFIGDFQKKKNESQHRKLKRLFFGYQQAYEKDKENNALIYLHLTPSQFLQVKLTLIDRFGFTHRVNLDDMIFVLQERGEATRKVISKLLDHGDIEGAKSHFRQILDLYREEYQKGIWDRDHNVMYNTGFVKEKAVRLDVGRLRVDDRYKKIEYFKPDIEKIGLQRINRWLHTHYPQYREELMRDVIEKLDQMTSNAKNPLPAYLSGPPLISKASQYACI